MKINDLLTDNFFLIAGPCVIESEQLCLDIAGHLKEVCANFEVPYVFKASFDKANRTSAGSFRGPGIDQGLAILQKVKDQIGVPVLTDVHEDTPMDQVAHVVDILQTPAFLCRQTNFLKRAAETGAIVNVKKGQFLSPMEMRYVVDKVRSFGNNQVMVTERGFSFGYNQLVSDMRSLVIMRDCKCPVIFDATHSVQMPGGAGGKSGGQREFVAPLARAAVATGIDGLFMETHPSPDDALSDGPNSLHLKDMARLIEQLVSIHQTTKEALAS